MAQLRFNQPNSNGFTELGEHIWLRDPNIIVKADAISYKEIIAESDLYNGDNPREVIYEDENGTKWHLECVPYLHPTGAADITLGTIAYDATTGLATFTNTSGGLIIDEDGGLFSSGEKASLAAGQLFGDYFYKKGDNLDEMEVYRATKIEEGDFTWVIRRARTTLPYTGSAPASGDMLMASTTSDGSVEVSTAIDTTSAATLWTTLKKNVLGEVTELGCAVGIARAAGSGGWVVADLKLPYRLAR